MSVEEAPLIDRTYLAETPSGRRVRVNCFDYNLACFCDPNLSIQLEDKSWIQFKNLRIVEAT